MTPPPRAPNRQRLGAPHLVVPMVFAHQGMGNLMKQRVGDFFRQRSFGEFVGQGNHLRRVLTTPSAFRAIVKLETPLLEAMRSEQRFRHVGNGGQGFWRPQGMGRYRRLGVLQ
jgi:hypothetical protein